MADFAESYTDRGRRPDPRDEDHTRDTSPDRAETVEQRGRKSRDNQNDHRREFSPKENAAREDPRGQNRGYNHGQHGQGRGGYGRGQGQYNHQDGQYYQWGRGQYQQQGRGRNFQGRWQGQNDQQEWRGDWNSGQGGQYHREQYNHRGRQQGHYNDRNQRENGERSQEAQGYGGRRRRLDYGGNRQNQRNYHGSAQGPSNPSPSKRARYMSDFDSHYQKRQNRFNYKDEDPVVFLSKKLSFILRHGAEKMGFRMMPGGFLWVDEILRRNEYRDFTQGDIIHIVKSNDKQRFSLATDDNGRLKIRANQGHSLEVDGLELTPITDSSEAPEVIHGTYLQSWNIIKEQGLNKMGRNHIHFAAGEPGENGVISGMRSSCEVIIKLNMEKALKGGLKFFRSANNVILSPGDADGFIRPCYFDSAFQRYPRARLVFNNEIKDGPSIPGLSGDMTKKKKKKNKNKNREYTEGEKAKREKSNTGEQEVNMEGATSMFSEDSSQEAAQETDKATPQTLGERPTCDGTIKDEASIPGPSGESAKKKNKRKNKGNKNSEEADEEATNEANMAVPQPQEVVPDSWDGNTDKSDNAANSTPVKLVEFTSVDDKECCMSAVEELRSTGPVFVYCHLEGEEVAFVVCVSKTRAFNFDTQLLTEGDLHDFLSDRSSVSEAKVPSVIKIFNNIADTSKVLFNEYSIVLDGTNPYDNKVALDFVDEMGLGDMSKLPGGFDPDGWGNLNVGPELLDKCQLSLQAYEILSRWTEPEKKFKKSLFDEVNRKIDKERLKEEKEKRKGKGNQRPAAVESNVPTGNTGKNNKKSKKKNKK